MNLREQKCVPCEGGIEPLSKEDAMKLNTQVSGWQLSDDVVTITKQFAFTNFVDALAFVNKVGAIAEGEGHHPDIELGWGKVRVVLTTHAIKGLSINDFVVASKIDEV